MKFQVYKDGRVLENFDLNAAYMFGADKIPLRDSNKIVCKNGLIECRKKTFESAGIGLLWSVEGFGKVLMTTTRLPERKQPYNLNVELARAKLMQITLKREDWALFEEANGFAELVHEAGNLFIEALKNIADPAKASVLADEALAKALLFSESLAGKHADILLAARIRNKTLSRHSLGCQINPALLEKEKYRKSLFDMFGFVTIPINWAEMEPQKDHYDFSVVDRCIDLLANKRLALCAGPLLCFSQEHVPAWLLKEKGGFEKIREHAYEFAARVVTRYSRYIHAWRAISGMNALNCFGFDFEQIIEMTRTACLAARSAGTNSRKMVELLFPWGEYYANDKNTIPPLIYADMVIQSGIGFDAFAFQLNFGKDSPGMHIRDLMEISARLDAFAAVAKPIHITGMAIPDSCGPDAQDCNLAGFWHKPWDQQIQAQWIEQVYKIVLAKPFIHSITYSNLADSAEMEVLKSGLMNEKFEPKKVLISLAKMQRTILRK